MMWRSDNRATDSVVRRFDRENIDYLAASIGMESTQINHILGCGGPTPNDLTLRDTFYDLMSGKGDTIDRTGGWDSLKQTKKPLRSVSPYRIARRSRTRCASPTRPAATTSTARSTPPWQAGLRSRPARTR